MRVERRSAAGVVATVVLALAAGGSPAADRSSEGAGPRAARSALSPWTVAVDPAFAFVGSQRFVLRERADVEQFLFVETSHSRAVSRFVWIQFERFLPGIEDRYEYAPERVAVIGGHEFVAGVRRYTEPPDSGSDRSRAYELVESKGFEMPAVAIRARLVHVFPDGRSELMIVYAERAANDGEPAGEAALDLIRRATALVDVSSPSANAPRESGIR
jgi:hypothetical protein